MKTLHANRLLAYFFLTLVVMAGLSYINYLPGLVSALAGAIGFNAAEAGQIVALNGYGGIVGSVLAIFLVRGIRWKPVMAANLFVLAAMDAGTVWIEGYYMMLGWRFAAGVLGGLCVGIGFALLARLENPDRAFGLLLFVQFSIGSIVIYFLPGLEALFGAFSVFYVMATLVLLGLCLIPLLPPLDSPGDLVAPSNFDPGLLSQSVLLLLAILLYQCAASAIWAYVGVIGLGAGISAENVSGFIAATGLLGLLGAMLPVVNGSRFGRLYWLIGGAALSLVSAILMSARVLTAPLYITSMSLLFFSWPAVQSYLLAVTAEMDNSGRLSTIAAVVSSVGLASGPLLASFLLGEEGYSNMLYICALIFMLAGLLFFRPAQAREHLPASVFSSQGAS